MRHQRITRSTMLGLAIAAIAVPSTQARPADDLRSPDARDTAQSHVETAAQPAQDLRSPDARDVVQGWSTVSASGLTVVDALTGVAPAGANEQTRAALAQERYYSSYGEPGTTDAATSAALAQERYYSSYGEPEPLTVADAPEPSDDAQWLPIALSVSVALAILAASATTARRLRIRRRATRVTT